MAFTSNNIYINLSVKDVSKTTNFFKELGFAFNPHFSDETTSCMIISEHIYAMLMQESRFQEFTKKDIVDTTSATEVILSLKGESKNQIDEFVNKAISLGAKSFNDPQDHGFMYIWGFEDLDGHLWEIAFMDPSQLSEELSQEE